MYLYRPLRLDLADALSVALLESRFCIFESATKARQLNQTKYESATVEIDDNLGRESRQNFPKFECFYSINIRMFTFLLQMKYLNVLKLGSRVKWISTKKTNIC